MNVSLTVELEDYVHLKVNSGLYNSASEVVRDALRLMHERDRVYASRLKKLKADVDLGLRQIAAGELEAFDKSAADEIKSEGRRRAASRKKKRA